jgi:ABC-type amino acid transport substrate-binding protein
MTQGGTSRRRIIGALALALAPVLTTAGLAGCSTGSGQPGASTAQSLYTIVKSRGVLRVGVRPDDPPHSYLNSQGHLAGFDVDVATAIASYWGVKLQLVTVNELTRISYLSNGRIDLAVTSISKTVSRAKEVDFRPISSPTRRSSSAKVPTRT